MLAFLSIIRFLTGTQKVIDTAIQCNVPYLVYISGADVAIGCEQIYYGSENTTLIPKRHVLGAYSKTKYEAETLVVESNERNLANGKGKLQTTILRPTWIYGEEDQHFVTRMLNIAKQSGGWLRRVDNLFVRLQPVYAGNVAAAVIKVKDRLQVDPSIGGEAFFITDDTKIIDPFDFVEPYVKARGFQLTPRAYPYWAVFLVLAVLQWLVQTLWSVYPVQLPQGVNTKTVDILCHTYFFNRTKATLRFDYEPMFTHEQSEERSLKFYRTAPLEK